MLRTQHIKLQTLLALQFSIHNRSYHDILIVHDSRPVSVPVSANVSSWYQWERCLHQLSHYYITIDFFFVLTHQILLHRRPVHRKRRVSNLYLPFHLSRKLKYLTFLGGDSVLMSSNLIRFDL